MFPSSSSLILIQIRRIKLHFLSFSFNSQFVETSTNAKTWQLASWQKVCFYRLEYITTVTIMYCYFWNRIQVYCSTQIQINLCQNRKQSKMKTFLYLTFLFLYVNGEEKSLERKGKSKDKYLEKMAENQFS